MPSWAISAIFTNVTTAWERNFSSYRTVQSTDVRLLLRDVDEVLRSTSSLLENHRRLLPPGEYESFKAQHRTYEWMWLDEHRQKDRAKDEIAQQRRAAQLFESVKTYRSTLLDASRNAAVIPRTAFPDEVPDQTDSQTVVDPEAALPAPELTATSQTTVSSVPRPHSPPRIPGMFVLPSNVGLMRRLKTLGDSNPQTRVRTTEPSTGGALIEDQGFAVAVAHIAVDPEKNLYKRRISVKYGDQQREIIDPEPRVLEPGKVDVDEETLTTVCALVIGSFQGLLQKTAEELLGEID